MKRFRVNKEVFSQTKPAFGFYGSKNRIAPKIVSEFPPHNAWVEAFCGSAAVTLAKAPAPIEIINDMDDQIINLFEQIRDNQDALCRSVALTPYARAEFVKARKAKEDTTPLEKARRFLVASMMTINGAVGGKFSGFSFSNSYSRGGREARVNRWLNLPQRIEDVAKRLKSVRIENRDAREILKMFSNRPATLIYLDPPYLINRKQGYCVDARDTSFHEELLNICNDLQCMILISGYDIELYNSFLTQQKGWIKEKIATTTRDTTGKDYERIEVLWKNRSYMNAVETKRLPINLHPKEKSQGKLNPTRKRRN